MTEKPTYEELEQRVNEFETEAEKRKQAEEALREGEAKYRKLLERSPDPIAIVQENRHVYINAAHTNLFGYTTQDVNNGLDLLQLIPENKHAFVIEREKERLEGKEHEEKYIIIDLVAKGGEIIPCEISGNLIDFEGCPATLVIIRDITERKRAEEALRESEERFRSLVELTSDWIWEVNQNGIFTYADPKIKDFLGYEPEEVVGKPYNYFMSEDSKQRLALTFKDQTEKPRPFSRRNNSQVHQDGRHIMIETSGLPICDIDGKVVGWRGITSDITEREEAEEELRKYRDHLEELVKQRTMQLENANKEMEAFAYSVSHDLRAPLRAIDGFSLALLEDYEDKLDDEGKGYLSRVRAGSQRMGQLIDDILNLSRLTRSDMHYESVDLSAIAHTITRELQSGDPERHVEVRINPNLIVRGDLPLLQIVMENLISNAWKFTAGQERAQITFGTEIIGEETAFFVRDNGAGFDMAYVDKIFGAFQRLHSIKEFPGSGIGLATVQRAIHRHGGRIWAKGAVDQGATFYFTL